MDQTQGIKFYGIERDAVSPRRSADYGPDWTRPDLPWRACWVRSEYHALASGARLTHSLAAFLGSLTGAAVAAGLLYLMTS